MLIAFPPCTHLARSGARWFKEKKVEQEKALDFVRLILNAKIPRICLENPVGIISTKIRQPTQIIQPNWFGHFESKKTCLWLKNLPKLEPTDKVPAFFHSIHAALPRNYRWKLRSRTFTGVAKAMATQWSLCGPSAQSGQNRVEENGIGDKEKEEIL